MSEFQSYLYLNLIPKYEGKLLGVREYLFPTDSMHAFYYPVKF